MSSNLNKHLLSFFIFEITGNPKSHITSEEFAKHVLLNYNIPLDELITLHEATNGVLTRVLYSEFSKTTDYLTEVDLSTILFLPIAGITAILKLPSHLIINVARAINYVASKLKKNTEFATLITKVIRELPKECRLIFYNIEMNSLNQLIFKKILNMTEKDLDSALFDFAARTEFAKPFPSGSYNVEKLTRSRTIECYLKYAIEVLKVNLSLYYKCLYDNKQFLDLTYAINNVTELLADPDVAKIVSIVKMSKNTCEEFLEAFVDMLKIIDKIISYIYKNKDNEKYQHYRELIIKTIESVNKEYEKKLKDNKKKDGSRDKQNKQRNT